MAEEDKLSSRFLLQGLTAWELTGPACSRAYEPIKHLMETVLPFQCQKGTAVIGLSCLDSNYLHLQATKSFSAVQVATPSTWLSQRVQDGFAEAGASKSKTKQHLPTCSDEESGCAPAKSLRCFSPTQGSGNTQSLQQPVPSQG